MPINFLNTIRVDEAYGSTKAIEFGDEFIVTSNATITQVNNLVNSGVTYLGVTDSSAVLQYGVSVFGGGKVLLAHDGNTKLETTSVGLEITGNVTANSSDLGRLTMTDEDIDGAAINSNGEYGVGSQVLKHRTDATVAGNVYSLTSAGWAATDASTVAAASTGLLGVAFHTSSGDGMIVKGVVQTTVTGTLGDIVYLSTTSAELTTAPATAQNNVIRIVGYLLATNLVYFDPSQDYIKIA